MVVMKALAILAIACALPVAAAAQTYPAKPVKLLIGFAPGGPTDVIGRVLAQEMAAALGQAVIVENKTGANALIATQEAKRAAPNGYTVLMTTLSHNVNAILMADNNPYDPIKDFTPVSLVCLLPLVLVTGPSSPFNSVQDVVAAAKANPDDISYASAGNGGSAHLAGAAACDALQNQDDACALSRQCAGAHRGDGRPRKLHVLSNGRHCATGGAKAAESARREHGEAASRISRRADDERGGIPGLRGLHSGARHCWACRDG